MTKEEIIKKWAILYYKKMFEGCPLGREDSLSHVFINFLKKITVSTAEFKLIFLEQNPRKKDIFGERAKTGHKIMWFIVAKGSKKKRLGRVEDGKWFPSKK